MKQQEVLVSIRCLVYNHEPYLRQCLDGFVMQKTNFAFEAIVHDDASTDKSADIIKEYAEKYPDIIKPIFETENQYSKRDGSIRRIMNDATSKTTKYIALCEGDDYWTDPLKLQKQFDFMEANTEYGLIYTKTKTFEQYTHKYLEDFGNDKNTFEDLIKHNSIPTLTCFLRKDILLKYYIETSEISKDWLMGDYPLWLYCSIISKIKFMDQTTAVYRVLAESASHSSNPIHTFNFNLSGLSIQLFFINKWRQDLDNKLKNTVKLDFYIKNIIIITNNGDTTLKKELCEFMVNNKLYGLLIFYNLFNIFKHSRHAIAILYKIMNTCIKNNIIKSNI